MSIPTSVFARAKARMSPEIAHALSVILNALFEEPEEDIDAKVKQWTREGAEHVRRTRERIERAERGVKTRRKNAKKRRTKKTCNSSTTRANSRQYCFKTLGHRGVHSNGFYNWKRPAKKVKRK